MKNPTLLSYEVTSDSYGQVRAMPILLANELNSKLERWFQNCKYAYLSISNLSEEDYNSPLQLEYTYSRRILPQRDFSEIKSAMTTEIDLLNYHQLVKIVHEFIEKAHRIYLSLSQEKQGDNVLKFERHIDSLCNSYHKKNFPKKLEIISKDIGLDAGLDILKQINKVRNCLEHRAGIVSQIDCDPGKNYMSIRWRYPKVASPSGEISPLSDIKGKQSTETSFTDEVKKFRRGEKILFDFYDNSKCIYSLNICFKEIIDGFYKVFNVKQEIFSTIIREFKNV